MTHIALISGGKDSVAMTHRLLSKKALKLLNSKLDEMIRDKPSGGGL